MKFTGELSTPGSYGHLGMYPREVTVLEVLDVALASECSETAAGPPAVTASSGNSVAGLGLGTYCWTSESAEVGLCVDAVGIITNGQPLDVNAGDAVDLTARPPWSDPHQLNVTAQEAVGEPGVGASGTVAWDPSPEAVALEIAVSDSGASFVADLEPGEYVVHPFVMAPREMRATVFSSR